tara:strand:- start:272 stop:1300 length:1029 start_codon:yes stop_codon:yes gene_type:complete
MKKNLVIINNEKCIKKEGGIFCENLEISSITELLGEKFNLKLILRESIVSPVHLIDNKDIKINSNIFFFIMSVIRSAIKDNSSYLIISVTPYTFVSFLFLFLLRKKMFLYLRSDGKKEISAIFGRKVSIVYKFVENLMANFSDLIVVNNLISKKKEYHLVSPSQIDGKWSLNIKNTERNQIKLLYVGRLKIEKGIFSLVDIFNNTKLDHKKEISLTLIGRGNKPKNFNNKIKFVDQISSKRDLIKQYDSHDIFILPSFTEGHPQVLIESLIRQRPVIVFREIEHVSQNYEGVFVIDRSPKDLSNIIEFIDKNYNEILERMKKNKYPTKENFSNQLYTILSQN